MPPTLASDEQRRITASALLESFVRLEDTSVIEAEHLVMIGVRQLVQNYPQLFIYLAWRDKIDSLTDMDTLGQVARIADDQTAVGRSDALWVSRTGAELLFQVFADRYERGNLLVNSNLAFSEWEQVFQGERMTAALLDRLTHHCHIFEMNGESCRFKQSVQKGKSKKN